MSETQNNFPTSWVQFTDDGLIIKSKSEIMSDLDTIDKLSFGSDMADTSGSAAQSNVMGTAWYTHNELLAQCIASIGSAVKAIYDSTNIMSCTGRNLDNRVLGAGITRREGESDAALRYRYLIAVSTPSISTSEGLTARLTGAQFQNNDGDLIEIKSVLITQNTGSDPTDPEDVENPADTSIGIDGHSILVCLEIPGITDGTELETYKPIDTQYGSKIDNAVKYIGYVIQQYKTLGCGTNGSIDVQIPDTSYTVWFSLVTEVSVSIKIEMSYSSATVLQETYLEIQNKIKESITNYMDSFSIGKDVLFNDILSLSQQVIISYGYSNNEVSVNSISITGNSGTANTVNSEIDIKADQIARLGVDGITFTDSGTQSLDELEL